MNCYLATHFQSIVASFSTGRVLDRPNEGKSKKKEMTRTVDYATRSDFCKVFDDHIDDLYTLSFLLTADHQKAEQCFVSGLQDCLQGNAVFREWAQSWAKRVVIKNAIRMISPLRNEPETAPGIAEPASEADGVAGAITSLQPFDRFAYVLSVLEHYADRECSILLDCTVEKVVEARIRALQRLATANFRKGAAEITLTRGAA